MVEVKRFLIRKITTLFWIITQQIVIISHRRLGTIYVPTFWDQIYIAFGLLTSENGTDKLSRNVGMKLSLLTAL
jgi:hypothetical protein